MEVTKWLKPSDEGCTKYVRDGEAFLEADFVGPRDPTAMFVSRI
jgi:hypothetical protein